MSYATVAAALETVIKTLDQFDPDNVRRNDYSILARGKSKAVIIMPGRFLEHGKFDDARYRTVWFLNIELFIGFVTDRGQLEEDIEVQRQAIIDVVDTYPTLNGTEGVVSAVIIEGSEPVLSPRGKANMWWEQTLFCRVEERASVTYAE